MFVLVVSYSKSPEIVAEHVSTHSEWVKKHLSQGNILLVGPKTSKLGGVLLVKSMEKQQLLDIIAEDSYVKHDVADYQITEFDCKATHNDLEVLKRM